MSLVFLLLLEFVLTPCCCYYGELQSGLQKRSTKRVSQTSVKVSDLEMGAIQLRQYDDIINLKKGGNTE